MDEQLEGQTRPETGKRSEQGPGRGVEQWTREVPQGHLDLDQLAMGPHCWPHAVPRAWLGRATVAELTSRDQSTSRAIGSEYVRIFSTSKATVGFHVLLLDISESSRRIWLKLQGGNLLCHLEIFSQE